MSEQTESAVTVEEIDTADLSPLHRQGNRALFISWVNAGLRDRFGLDVLGSVMLYDAEKYFVYAAPELPDAETLRALRAGTTIRYWSRGI